MSALRSAALRSVLAFALALAGTATAIGQAPAPSPEARRQGLEQKLKLVESLLNSPKIKQAAQGDNAEAKGNVEKAQQLVDAARAALKANELDQASPALDEALRSITAASRPAQRAGVSLDLSAQRTRHAELTEQLRTYRASLEQARQGSNGAPAGEAIEKIDRMSAQAAQLAEGGKLEEANKILGQAYMAAVTSLSNITAGQTVVLSLKFDTPADEYAYEQKRNHSHHMMIDMMVTEGRVHSQMRVLVDRFIDEDRRLRVEAEQQAKAGDFASAIKTMERATQQLVRALQTIGVPVY